MASKVLHIAPTPFFADRGCHMRIRGLVLALEKEGLECPVCTYPIGRDVPGVVVHRCAPIPGYTKTEAGPSAYKYLADILLVFTVIRQILVFRPDVLHCHLHEGVLVGWVARALTFRWGTPIVMDMQGSLVGELEAHGYFEGKPFRRWLFTRIEALIVAMATEIVCSSKASSDFLSATYNLDASRVTVVPDGADVAPVDPAERRMRGHDELVTACYTGGLSTAKGQDFLLELIRGAHVEGLPIRFEIVGFPTDTLEQFVTDNAISNVTIHGQVPVDRLAGLLGRADIAIEPKPAGSGEASGKLINYMAAGLPVVCFDTPNNRTALDGNAYFAESSDESLLPALERALRDRDRFEEITSANLATVKERYSWDAQLEALEPIIKKLIPCENN